MQRKHGQKKRNKRGVINGIVNAYHEIVEKVVYVYRMLTASVLDMCNENTKNEKSKISLAPLQHNRVIALVVPLRCFRGIFYGIQHRESPRITAN